MENEVNSELSSKDLEMCTLGPGASMKEAIAKLSSNRRQIVVVVDQSSKVVGSVTDGDIRRALLKNFQMDCPVEQFMNHAPKTALTGSSDAAIKQVMIVNQIEHVPLVDEEGHFIDLRTMKDLINQPHVPNTVLLMAGGFGKRLLPLTADTPKPMLKIGDRPMLEVILQQFLDAGFSQFVISTHYRAEIIKEYFGDGSGWGAHIAYVEEEEPLGTGGALSLLPDQSAPIVVANGDVISSVNFLELLEFHTRQKSAATMAVRDHTVQIPFGVVEGRDLRVESITEKPEYRYFINAGIYVIDARIANGMTEPNHVDMPDLLRDVVASGDTVSMYPIHENWSDVGHHEELVAVRNKYDK
ncbi:MAG: nucleotidyltransferase family protein [Dinoroseobacter sp.]|nr:nucleotidyltransferase family protein [Dinoroseobacter sp.]